MSQLPITSRIKRSPLLKGSPYKQSKTPKASTTAEGEETTEIITVPGVAGTENLDELNEGKKDLGPDYKPSAAETARANAEVAEAKAKDAAAAKPIEKEIVVKGDDVIAPTYSKRTGDVQTNFDGRQLARQTKFKNRFVRQSKNKLAKSEDRMANFQKKYSKAGVDADGNPTSTFTAPKPGEKGYRRYKKLDARITENRTELADFEQGSRNQAEVMRSGRTIGKTTRMDDDRRDTAGDQTKDERIAQVRAENAAQNQIVTESNSQAENAVKVNSNTGGGDNAVEGEADNTKYGEYKPAPAAMKPSAFKMKAKSPAAKKLQGNQGRLPQHLQDAIKSAPESPAKLGPLAAIAGKALVGALASKAVSSNKMRSGFKMKGYGKK